MQRLSVHQLAAIAGVSVRTLHHYDKIGLLKPGTRSESNYRYYGQAECLRLQQILLYRELELPLAAIKELIDDPDFDLITALQAHRKTIQLRKQRLSALLKTVDLTIDALKSKTVNMDYRTFYGGFSKETAEAYKKEAIERWGEETVQQSHDQLLRLTKNEWEALQAFTEDLNRQLAAVVELDVHSAKVQHLISLHFELTGKHFAVTKEIYEQLGVMYAEDERFRAYYEAYDKRLPDFMKESIAIFCSK